MQGEKNSVVKVIKHWKGDRKGVGFLSLDPVKIQCDEALNKLIQLHICFYFHSEDYFGEILDPQKVPSNLNHSTMNLTAACIKPFKTHVLFQAVSGLFKITWKPPAETEKIQ